MKKFLAILLIAAIAGSFIDELKEAGLFDERDDVVLEGLPDFFRRLWGRHAYQIMGQNQTNLE